MDTLANFWPLVAGLLYMAICGFYQWSQFRVPNVLTLLAIIAGLTTSVLVEFGIAPGAGGIASSLLAAIVGFAGLIMVYAKGHLGAGCVKCNAAFGVWLGCSFSVGSAIALVVVSTIASIALTSLAMRFWEKNKLEDSLFPAQITMSLASIATVLASLAW